MTNPVLHELVHLYQHEYGAVEDAVPADLAAAQGASSLRAAVFVLLDAGWGYPVLWACRARGIEPPDPFDREILVLIAEETRTWDSSRLALAARMLTP